MGKLFRSILVGCLVIVLAGCDSAQDDEVSSFRGSAVVIEGSGAFDGLGGAVAISGDYAIASAVDQDAAIVFKREGSSWVEAARLQTKENDELFGRSVDIDGDIAVVGGGVGAYVFERTGEVWNEVQNLRTFGRPIPSLGSSVSISGEMVAVGAPLDTGVIARFEQVGSVFLFEKRNGNWFAAGPGFVLAPDQEEPGLFGQSVAMSGNTLVVGVPGLQGLNDTGGGAYVFERQGDDWELTAKLLDSAYVRGASSETAHFGWSVDVDGDYAVVGSLIVGAVSVFRRQGDAWFGAGTLFPPGDDMDSVDRGIGFGRSVSLKDGHVVAGAMFKSLDNLGREEGGAYLFRREGNGWGEGVLLTATEPDPESRFGISVDIDGEFVMVGAPSSELNGERSGAAFVFEF